MRGATIVSLLFAVLELVRSTGIEFRHRNSPTTQKYLPETMSGGVALLDYDGDGLLDVFLVNGGRLTAPQKRPADFARNLPPYWNRLYRQNRDGSFIDVTAAAGLSRAGNAYGMGVAVGDIDNDGFADIYVTNYGHNSLYRNNGDGTFTDITVKSGVAAAGWSVSAGFLDYDNDGRLDLFVARYLDYDLDRNILCGTPFHAYCRPEKYAGTTNLLYHNEGGGRFRDVSEASRISLHTGKGMGVGFNDYDGDGFVDIFVANDLMEQFLFRNRGNGTFEERAVEAGVALSEDGKSYSGMGVAFEDYDNNGLPDILVTNLALEKWALYRNTGDGQFSYASATSGLAALVARSSGWGAGFYDFDNDGWKDVFAAQSHVLDNVERMNSSLSYLEVPGAYRNIAGRFEKVDLRPLPAVAGRGVAFGDLNNDGAVDAIVAVLGGRPLVVRGHRTANHWLTVKLSGRRSNRQGIGANVRIGRQSRFVTTSGSYLSASDVRAHFGVGAQTEVAVEILWPSGVHQTLENVSVDRIITVTEPE
jgi:hypothetical protein